jgi:5'-nucleotidase
MKSIIISNQEDFEKKKKAFIAEGRDRFHIITDFDRTLTKAYVNGNKFRSIISQLYEGNSLTEDYRKKAKSLQDKYYPIEINSDIPLDEKKKVMDEWWRSHKKLLIDSGLNLNDIRKVVDEGHLEFRKGVPEFFEATNKAKVPVLVFSASGIGEIIPLYFKKINRLYDTVHIVTNSMNYDEEGNAISIREPVIHVFNKGEIALKGLPVMKKLEDRVNVILLGDSLGDIQMTEGFNYKNIIRIGFYNYEDEEKLEDFKDKYDVVITGDGDMDFINSLFEELLKQ